MKNGIFLLFILLISFGCTEPFTIHTDNSPPVPVIYGVLTDELKHQEVMITRSSAYFDNQPNVGISGAEVRIQSSDNEIFRLVEGDSIGLYVSETAFAARIGTEYTLSVETDFNGDGQLDRYEASTTILPPAVIDSVVIESLNLMGRKNHVLWAYFQDPPGENYMMYHILYNDSLLTAKISNSLVSNDELMNGQQIKASLRNFSDISEKDKDKDNPERQSRRIYLQEGDKVEAAVSLIPKGYFDFVSQCKKEMGGENPMFGGPASNIATNISNGGVGYFVGYSVVRTSYFYN